MPLSRPSVTTQVAPGGEVAARPRAHCRGVRPARAGPCAPTSASTTKRSAAAAIRSRFSAARHAAPPRRTPRRRGSRRPRPSRGTRPPCPGPRRSRAACRRGRRSTPCSAEQGELRRAAPGRGRRCPSRTSRRRRTAPQTPSSAVDVAGRQPLVEHVGDPGRRGLRGALGQREEAGRDVHHDRQPGRSSTDGVPGGAR